MNLRGPIYVNLWVKKITNIILHRRNQGILFMILINGLLFLRFIPVNVQLIQMDKRLDGVQNSLHLRIGTRGLFGQSFFLQYNHAKRNKFWITYERMHKYGSLFYLYT